MRRVTLAVLVGVLIALSLLACSLGEAAVTPATNFGSRATAGEVIFVSNLYQVVEEGIEVRTEFRKVMQDTLDRKTSLSKFVAAAEKSRDWHLAAVTRVERASDNAPAEYKKLARLYSDFLRDYAESLDLMARGIKEDSTALLERGVEKLKKAMDSNDAFSEELDRLFREKTGK